MRSLAALFFLLLFPLSSHSFQLTNLSKVPRGVTGVVTTSVGAKQVSTAVALGETAISGIVSGAMRGGIGGAAIGGALAIGAALLSANGTDVSELDGVQLRQQPDGQLVFVKPGAYDSQCYVGGSWYVCGGLDDAIETAKVIISDARQACQYFQVTVNPSSEYEGWVRESASVRGFRDPGLTDSQNCGYRSVAFKRWVGDFPATYQPNDYLVKRAISEAIIDDPARLAPLLHNSTNGQLRDYVQAQPEIADAIQRLNTQLSDLTVAVENVQVTELGNIPQPNISTVVNNTTSNNTSVDVGGSTVGDVQVQVDVQTLCEKTPDVDACLKTVAEVNIDCSVVPTCSGNQGFCGVIQSLHFQRCAGLSELEMYIETVTGEVPPVGSGSVPGDGSGWVQPYDISFIGEKLSDIFNTNRVSETCPPDPSINLLGNTYLVSFQPFCDFARLIRPVVLLVGAWLSIMVVLRGVRSL